MGQQVFSARNLGDCMGQFTGFLFLSSVTTGLCCLWPNVGKSFPPPPIRSGFKVPCAGSLSHCLCHDQKWQLRPGCFEVSFVDAVQFPHMCLGVDLFFLLDVFMPPVFVGLYLSSVLKRNHLFNVSFPFSIFSTFWNSNLS